MRIRPGLGLVGPKGISLAPDLDTSTLTNTLPHLTSVSGQAAGVQRSGQSSSALALTYPNPTTTGNLLVLVLSWFAGSAPSFTVTDNAGNTWNLAVTNSNSLTNGVAIYYVAQATGNASLQITVTPSVSVFLSAWINEYHITSPSANGALDQTSGSNGNSSSPTSGSVTTATAGQLYVGALNPITGGTPTTENGWANRYTQPSVGNFEGISVETLGDGSSVPAGSQTATWTTSGGNWAAVIATFKP
jgi:hypothetical protein